MVYRVYVEKKKELAHEANSLKKDITSLLQIKNALDVRVINRYDVENIEAGNIRAFRDVLQLKVIIYLISIFKILIKYI